MKPEFFFHKMREVKSFLQIMRGRITGSKKDRVEGVNNALNAMKDEREVYLDEKREAKTGDKVQRESGRDVSAI